MMINIKLNFADLIVIAIVNHNKSFDKIKICIQRIKLRRKWHENKEMKNQQKHNIQMEKVTGDLTSQIDSHSHKNQQNKKKSCANKLTHNYLRLYIRNIKLYLIIWMAASNEREMENDEKW